MTDPSVQRRITLSYWAMVAVLTVIVAVFSVLVVAAISSSESATKAAKRADANTARVEAIARQNSRLLKRVGALAREGAQAHDTQCVVKADYARRVRETRAYLGTDPPPPEIPGIPRATIRSQLANLESTLRSLGGLTCPTAKTPAA